jgi:hypothetical protein
MGQYYMVKEGSPPFPIVPAVATLGVVGLGVVGYLVMRPAYSYQTYDYEHAQDMGLLNDPDHEVHHDDGSSEGFYDEDYD